MIHQSRQINENGGVCKQRLFTFLDRAGNKLLSIGNYDANLQFKFKNEYQMQFIGVLVREKERDLHELGSEHHNDHCDNDSVGSYGHENEFKTVSSVQPTLQDQKINKQIDEDSEGYTVLTDPNDSCNFCYVKKDSQANPEIQKIEHPLNLIFFFVANVPVCGGDQTEETILTSVQLSLSQIYENSRNNTERINFIMKQGLEKVKCRVKDKGSHTHFLERREGILLNQFKSKLIQQIQSRQDFFEVPKNWFYADQTVHWQDDIEISTTKFFNHIAILNKKQKLYLAFDRTQIHNEALKEIARFHIPDQSIASIIRNQCTKRFLFITVRIQGTGCITHCFYGLDQRQSINFKNDHIHAQQDVQTQEHHSHDMPFAEDDDGIQRKRLQNRFLLQSCSISDFDQEIMLVTQKAKYENKYQVCENVYRQSIHQRFSGNFPLFAYNLGFSKIIIQNTQAQQLSYIYNLPEEETFIDFIEYKGFEDIGFIPQYFQNRMQGLSQEMCSSFVFLTKKKIGDEKRVLANIIMINPYLSSVKAAVFQSTKFFEKVKFHLNQDMVIKNIMFCTKKSEFDTNYKVKLLTQFSDSFIITEFKTEHLIKIGCSQDLSDDDLSIKNVTQKEAEEAKEDKKMLSKKLASIPMLLSHRFIYYVIQNDDSFVIKQIDFKQDHIRKHQVVFDKRLKKIKSFGQIEQSNHFYFIDEMHSINVLKQNQSSMMLQESGQLYIKEQEKPEFYVRNFENLIVDDKYIINQCRIFYITKYPVPAKKNRKDVLDMEDLSLLEDPYDPKKHENKKSTLSKLKNIMTSKQNSSLNQSIQKINNNKNFRIGPIRFHGSDQFVLIYESDQSRQFNLRVYQLPDSSQVSLMNQTDHQVFFSTFFNHKNKVSILIKVGATYAIFDESGNFKCIVDMEYMDGSLAVSKNEDPLSNVIKLNFPIKREEPEELKNNERLVLLSMSNSNSYYLFADLKLKKIVVYELICSTTQQEDQKITKSYIWKKLKNKIAFRECNTDHFRFQPWNDIAIENTQIYKNLQNVVNYEDKCPNAIESENYQFNQFLKLIEQNVIKCKITDKGDVQFMTHNKILSENDPNIAVKVTFFKKKNFGVYAHEFKVSVNFPDNDSIAVTNEIINIEEKELEMLIEKEEFRQKSLHVNFQDNKLLSQLELQKEELKHRNNNIVQYFLFDNLMLVICGYQIKYGFIDQENLDDSSELIDKELKCQFDKDVEIMRILATKEENVIQIVAKEISDNILVVLTWDFNQNIERSVYQLRVQPDTYPERQIAKGLIGKMNYFIGEDTVFDLENNIPFQKAAHLIEMDGENLEKQNKYVSQSQQLYIDSSRYLCLESANLLHFPVTRIDILFWMCIIDHHKEDVDIIKQYTSLDAFNKIYANGQSLFHYFAHNVDVIEMLHRKFKDASFYKQLAESEQSLPLIILHPNDTNHQTALDIALQKLRPRSFELMIDMLQTQNKSFLTKMMLNSFPALILQDTVIIQKFFNSCIYKSPMMEMAQVIAWPQDKEEIIFSCHTSIISSEIMNSQIAEYLHKDSVTQSLSNEQHKHDANCFNQTELPDQNQDEEGQLIKRVSIEAIDLDWVFQKDNAQNLILLLCKNASGQMLTQNSIRIFIDIVWSKYQPHIIWMIFIPYVFYLIMFTELSSQYAGPYLDLLVDLEKNHETIEKCQWHLFYQSLSVLVCILHFANVERKQMKLKGFKRYFMDTWNFFDLSILILNSIYVIILNYYVYKKDHSYTMTFKIRTLGATTCLLLWIKMFYWMRIFKETAHFVTLISQTLYDVRIFMLMLTLILVAFSTFFFIINNNTYHNDTYEQSDRYAELVGDEKFYYLDNNFHGNCRLSALIQMYLMALGEFYFEGFRLGPNSGVAWIGFTVGTFIVLVVFMNLLIAIMGETFNVVKEKNDESSLMEQLGLIEDHIWLLDMQKIFEGQKYIIRLSPDEASLDENQNLIEDFQNIAQEIIVNNNSIHDSIVKSNEVTEKRMRDMIKQQQQKNNSFIKTISEQSKNTQKLILSMQDNIQSQMQAHMNDLKDLNNIQKGQIQDQIDGHIQNQIQDLSKSQSQQVFQSNNIFENGQ